MFQPDAVIAASGATAASEAYTQDGLPRKLPKTPEPVPWPKREELWRADLVTEMRDFKYIAYTLRFDICFRKSSTRWTDLKATVCSVCSHVIKSLQLSSPERQDLMCTFSRLYSQHKRRRMISGFCEQISAIVLSQRSSKIRLYGCCPWSYQPFGDTT